MIFRNKLPLNFTVIDYPTDPISIRIEKRKARLTDTGNPSEDNSWVYLHAPNADLEETTPPSTDVLDNYLGPIINVKKGHCCSIRWINTLGADASSPDQQEQTPIFKDSADQDAWNKKLVDMKMNPTLGIVTHLHGGKASQESDGWPLWPVSFQQNPHGLPTHRTYSYPNQQRAAMLWFHDHAMDNTAPQVFAGLAGLYFIRDEGDTELFELIGGENQEIPLVIQDRCFDEATQKVDYVAGLPVKSPSTEPGSDRPEFLGKVIFVNGRPSPYHELNSRIFRLRILNGSNARTYTLALMNPDSQTASGHFSWFTHRMQVIGTEGGLLTRSLRLAEFGYLTIAPGERRDVLLDLTGLSNISRLHLVNLAIAPLARNDNDPEPIFRYPNPRDLDTKATDPLDMRYSVLQEKDRTATNLCFDLAHILELQLTGDDQARPEHFDEKLEHILRKQADDDAFAWDGSELAPRSQIARNRFVLLMNNSQGLADEQVNGIDNWQDTQMWELSDPSNGEGKPQWKLPFAVDLNTIQSPAPGEAISSKNPANYAVVRRKFLHDSMNMSSGQSISASADTFSDHKTSAPAANDNSCQHTLYPPLEKTSIKAKAGTYERWYVANIGNGQPLKANETNKKDEVNQIPDMHPFHIHLVNFIVLRRWLLDETTNEFKPQTASIFDKFARDDTVRIHSNELLELLVYYPPGYVGDYPYHCHLVEHEDMGMMLHFSVD